LEDHLSSSSSSFVLCYNCYAHANCPTKRRMDKKCTFFFSEMTEFRLGKSSWRNSVREKMHKRWCLRQNGGGAARYATTAA
jgi:hypothetical protein